MAGSKGGKSGQWSARKAQLAVQKYKKRGGKYCGPKTKAQKSLTKWTKQDWGSDRKGDRYLPKKARKALTDAEYRRTSAKKRRDTAKGKQFSKQPKSIARKTAKYRKNPMSRRQHLQYMTGFGAAVLAEDYSGWGLRQMCGAGFGGGYNDEMYAQNQLERVIALANAANDLIEQGTPLMSWQKAKIATVENDLRGVLQGLQAIRSKK